MSLLDQAALAGQSSSQFEDDYPAPIQGRVAHIDADFVAYWASALSRDELDGIKPARTFPEVVHNATSAIDHLMRKAAATSYVLHVTPSASDKGGRSDQAIQAEYQAARKARSNRPPLLDDIRAYMTTEMRGIAHLTQEADDGLAQAAMAAMAAGEQELHVTVSKDKDLNMVPGWHSVDDELFFVPDGFGEVWLDKTKSTAKIDGYGTAFFWAQCLTGDSADSIPGLPKLAKKDALRVSPTKKWDKLKSEYGAATKLGDQVKVQRAYERLVAESSGHKPCGPAMAMDLLDGIDNDKDAFLRVVKLWKNAEKAGYEFRHWQTGAAVSATQALYGDMLLLWMRRTPSKQDVLRWIKTEVLA